MENVLRPTAYERFGRADADFEDFEDPIRFVQDLSPIHTSNVVKEWFEEHPEFELLPWPPKGADLNPIENVWSEMVWAIDAQNVTNNDQLWEKVSSEWSSLSERNQYWQVLSSSMPSRLRMVQEVQGDWTKY